jgi:hypothetical protein
MKDSKTISCGLATATFAQEPIRTDVEGKRILWMHPKSSEKNCCIFQEATRKFVGTLSIQSRKVELLPMPPPLLRSLVSIRQYSSFQINDH